MNRAPLLLLAAGASAVAVAALVRPPQAFVAEPPPQLRLPIEGRTLELERLGPVPPGWPGLGRRDNGAVTVAAWRYRERGATAAAEPVILWLKLATSSARSNRTYLRPAPLPGSEPGDTQGCLALGGDGVDPGGMLRAAPATRLQRLQWLLGLRPYNQQACWTLKP